MGRIRSIPVGWPVEHLSRRVAGEADPDSFVELLRGAADSTVKLGTGSSASLRFSMTDDGNDW